MCAGTGGLSPGAECERMALIALDVAWRIEVVVVARSDVFVRDQVSDIETDNLGGIIVSCSGFDALHESRNQTEIRSAHKSHEAIECPDCNATPEEAVEFSFEYFEVAVAC